MTRYQQGFYLFDNDVNVLVENLKGNGRIAGLNVIVGSTASIQVIAGTGSAVVDGVRYDYTSTATFSYTPMGSPFKSIIYLAPGGNMMESSSIPRAADPSGSWGKNSKEPAPPTLPRDCLPLAEIYVPTTATNSTNLTVFNYDTIPFNGVYVTE